MRVFDTADFSLDMAEASFGKAEASFGTVEVFCLFGMAEASFGTVEARFGTAEPARHCIFWSTSGQFFRSTSSTR
jgi:hypothetical protein